MLVCPGVVCPQQVHIGDVFAGFEGMNKIVSSGQMSLLLQDVHGVAGIAMRQLHDAAPHEQRTVTDVFLHEPFALGYAYGFAERACQLLQDEGRAQNNSDYIHQMIGAMLGDASVSASFVHFALSKSGDRDFEGGYDVGAHDLSTWYFGFGEQVPSGLREHLQNCRKCS